MNLMRSNFISAFELKKWFADRIGTLVNLDQRIKEQNDRYVLSYHRVLTELQAEKQGVHHSLWITPERFEYQIQWMINIGDIVDYETIMDSTRPNNRPLFSLTFDDGWKDNYETAVPILKKYQISAVFFLATDAISTGELYWPQDIATKTKQKLLGNPASRSRVKKALVDNWPVKIEKKFIDIASMEMTEGWIEALKVVGQDERQQRIFNYFKDIKADSTPLAGYIMNWDELRDLRSQGFFFGSHTHNHTILENISNREIEFELEKSKEFIFKNLQINPNSFCYPNGRYSGKEGIPLSRLGYLYGFCLDERSLRQCKNNYFIPRFIVNEKNSINHNYFKLFLLGATFYRSKPHRHTKEKI